VEARVEEMRLTRNRMMLNIENEAKKISHHQ
jgi:hypothetical protein